MHYSTSYRMSYEVMGTTLASACVCISATVLTQPTICMDSNTTGSARPIHLDSLLQHPYEHKICMNSNATVSARPIHLNSLLQHPYEHKSCMNSNTTGSAGPIHLNSLLLRKVVRCAEFANTVRSTRNISVSHTPLEPPEFTGYVIYLYYSSLG